MSDDDPVPVLPPVDPANARQIDPDALSPELLASLLADGDDELAAWVLSQGLESAPRPVVYDGLLADAMRLVGERWVTGQWSVAEEHLASQTLLRALDRIRPDLGPDGRIGPLAVLAGVAGEQHMIGLVCLDHVLRELGWTVATLGADVPAADLAVFVERNDPRLVALSASDTGRTAAVAQAVDAIRVAAARRPNAQPLPVMLGGRAASHPGIGTSVGVDWTGTSLVAAAAFADEVLRQLTVADA